MNVQFAHPVLLFFLWLVPAVGAWWYVVDRNRERGLDAFLSREMQTKLWPDRSRTRKGWQAGLVLAGLTLALIAAARPQWGTREETVFQRSRDLLIALDVSRSMLAPDVHPNRLQRAKYDIMDLVKELQGDRAALMAFRGKATMLCPLTTDYAFLRQALDAAGPDSAPRGETDIGDAIQKALDSFDPETGSHKAIILISDGEDLGGRALDAAAQAAARGIPIFTVGLGARDGVRIPNGTEGGYVRYQGNDVVTRLHDDALYAIATKTGGAYVPIGTAGTAGTTLGTLYRDHLRKVTARDLEETQQRRQVERYPWFLFPAFLCLTAATLLSRGRLRRRPAPPEGTPEGKKPTSAPLGKLVVVLLAMALWSVSATAQTNEAGTNAVPAPTDHGGTAVPTVSTTPPIPPGRAGARVAQLLYRRGQYAAAADAYRQAATISNPRAQRDFRFNAAVALYRDGQFQAAADLFRSIVLEERVADGAAAAGLGTALFQAAEAPGDPETDNAERRALLLTESGEAFQEAARAQAGDTLSRNNLGVVLERLPEARERARTARLMAEHGQTPPGVLAETMLTEQRALTAALMAAYTNDTPEQITQLEALAKRQENNADLWIPLKGRLLQAMAQKAGTDDPQGQLATLNAFIENTRDQMRSAAVSMKDLDPAGFNSAVVSEDAIYQMWKGVAPYESLLREDLRIQDLAIAQAATHPVNTEAKPQEMKDQQDKALELTRLFQERFAQTVPEGGTPTPTNAPPVLSTSGMAGTESAPGISAETRADILDLAAQAAVFQEGALQHLEARAMTEAIEQQRSAQDRLLKIRDRLPKPPPKPQPDQQDKPPQDQEKKQESGSGQEPQPQEAPSPEPPKEESTPETSTDAEPAQPKEAGDSEKNQAKKDGEMSERDLNHLLEKALMREREHEADKRRQRQQIPMSPNERDW